MYRLQKTEYCYKKGSLSSTFHCPNAGQVSRTLPLFFLYGYSGYNQISIALEDQEKTTFTCPYGTFTFKRMPFGLCNALATFQRCMVSIFSDLVEEPREIFMDDFFNLWI